MRKALLSAVAAIGISISANAHDTLIHAGFILNPEDGSYTENQYILIDDGLISEIGNWAERPHEGVDQKIDLSDKYVLPGLLDAHVHLTGDSQVHGYKRLTRSVPRQAITGVRNARRTLDAGFTTVRNLGAAGYADIALRDAINDGDVPGPRILAAGPSLGITGGHCDNNLLPSEYKVKADGVADGPWALRAKVRENKKYGANLIKFCATGGVLSKGTDVGAQQFSYEEMKAIVDEAHLAGMKVAAHAHGAKGIETAIEAGVDSIEHSSFITDAGIAAAKRKGVYLSMDVYNSDYILSEGEKAGMLEESLAKERVVGKIQRESFRRAVRAGAKMAFGSDAAVYPHGQNGHQFAYMVKWGMTPLQSIQAATIHNADLFGLSETVGSIKPGKHADIIALEEDPLENIEIMQSVSFVMKGGDVHKD